MSFYSSNNIQSFINQLRYPVYTMKSRGEKPDNPREYARQIFRENNISPQPDSELADLIADCSQYMKNTDLGNFLQAQKKFDGPVRVIDTDRKVEHWSLRECLKQLPDYMEASESAGLTYHQANRLLVHMLNSDPYNFSQVEITTTLMTRAYRRGAEAGVNISDSYGTIRDMITVSAKNGVCNGAFYAFSVLMRLGLSVEQASGMIMRLPKADGSASGYTFPHFNDAINSMLPAKVNPDLVVEVFSMLGGERPWFSLGEYKEFTEMMTFGCPSHGITPNEMLAKFIARKGDLKEMYADLNATEKTTIESYFTETFRELEFAAQPYRNKKSLNQGMRDLEKLAVAHSHRWEEVGEGMWVFDPAKETWYSLGGQLELPGMGQVLSRTADRIRHNFVAYDISALSNNPFLFHVHPEDLESFIAPPRETMAYPQFSDDITKFLTATPSRADYGIAAELMKESKVSTRSFIAHALGITEFTYPNDISQLEKMKEKSRDIRDQVMLNFDVNMYMTISNLVQRLVKNLNETLPQGFGVVLHPTGTIVLE